MGLITKKEKWNIPDYGDPSQVRLGTVIIDQDKCNGCKLCLKSCPGNALEIVDKKSQMRRPPEGVCIFCGCCTAICPKDAIALGSPIRATGYYKTIDQGEHLLPRLKDEW